MSSQARIDRLLPAAYPLGVALVLIPGVDAASRVWPLRVGEVAWRFGAVGIAMGNLILPLVGVFILMSTAALLGHKPLLKWLAVASYVISAGLLLSLALFALDSLEVRAGPLAQQLPKFDSTAGRALFTGALGVVTTAAFGRSGWKAAGRTKSMAHAATAQLLRAAKEIRLKKPSES